MADESAKDEIFSRIRNLEEKLEDIETALESEGVDINPHTLNGSGKKKPSDDRFEEVE